MSEVTGQPRYWRSHHNAAGLYGCHCQNTWGESFSVVKDSETGETGRMSQWYHAWYQPEPAPFSWLGPTEEDKCRST